MTLEELFVAILGVPRATLDEASSPKTIESWDSMATMKLVAAIEEAHDINLSTEEIRGFNSLGAARRMLAQRGIAA